jgi:hypothetical protein
LRGHRHEVHRATRVRRCETAGRRCRHRRTADSRNRAG